jgi:mono/diheme cytochrome c family protein
MSIATRPLLGLCALLLAGCDDMVNQARQTNYSPLVGPAAVPAGTVEYGFNAPKVPPVSLALLERGQERYRIYCVPCHSELGDGQGIVVQRGFPAPPSLQIERLRDSSPKYLYEVIAQGRGLMYPFADRVDPTDRWAIVAYIKALQRSESAAPEELPPSERGVRP